MRQSESQPETAAERQARQFDQLRHLGDAAMALAKASGDAARKEIDNPPKPESEPAPPSPRSTRPPNYAQIFMQAASVVRQIIALELRVAAGPPMRRLPGPSVARSPSIPPKPDPRRPLLQKVLHDAVRNDLNKARRRREIDADIEQELLADPDPANADLIAQTLHNICTRLGIDLDLSRVSDAFLDYDSPIKTPVRNRFRET